MKVERGRCYESCKLLIIINTGLMFKILQKGEGRRKLGEQLVSINTGQSNNELGQNYCRIDMAHLWFCCKNSPPHLKYKSRSNVAGQELQPQNRPKPETHRTNTRF